jgi:DNA-binding MarR family transcriptional regulator
MTARDEKIGSSRTMKALNFWHGVTASALRKMPIDLSARQTAVLLSVYLVPQPHSIRSLSEDLDISKPAICRAVDALERSKLVRRVRDKQDKRNVLIQRTVKGSVYLSEFAEIILTASKEAA